MPGVDHSAAAASIQANVHMILRHRLASATRVLLLAAVAFLVASPFLTRRGVGTGEAYNYSLAVADGVTQLRAGVFPVLAGQTPFAFNGRVHPLRNAPYLVYLAGAIDLGTGHLLGFPALQNLSLACSLLAGFFASYAALRWGTRCPPWPAAFLACVYGTGAALLASAYSLDLYMTVHAAPFVPLALAAVARQGTARSARNDFFLAAALAAAWWAHPPVALWLTVAAGSLRLLLWAAQPSWRSVVELAAAFACGLLLAGFPFISAYELTRYNSFFNADGGEGARFVAQVLAEVRLSFIGSVSPVTRSAGKLGDFQLGYVAWGLLAAVVMRLRQPGAWRGPRLAAGGLAGVAALLIALCVPVPYFTPWAWSRLPGVFYQLTNDWPMQRLYLITSAAVILASGLMLGPRAAAAWRRRPLAFTALLAVAAAWMAWETVPFLRRGFRDRWSAEITARNYLPSNLDLTITSYAFLPVPPTFSHGVMEPWTEFRLLGHFGRDPVASNYATGVATAATVAQGVFQQGSGPGPSVALYEPVLTLQPGRHYLLDFNWRTAPFSGVLSFAGPSLQRLYVLPHAGEAQAFGMSPGQRTALAISTSQTTAEPVRLRVLNPTGNPQDSPPPRLADFRLLAVDDARLPVRVQSWLPLRVEVTAPTDDCYLETPRGFIPGYAATVNGRRLQPVRSATGQVMIPVPAGESRVELRYPGTLLLRAAFWTSLVSWVAAAAMGGALLLGRGRRFPINLPRPRGRPAATWILAGLGAIAAATALEWNHLRSSLHAPGTVGPLLVRLMLPHGLTSRQQPIVVTGQRSAGNFVFLSYTDDSHLRVGVDIWGFVRLSEAVPADYNQEQDLVVDGAMLYPPGDPAMRALAPFARAQLRRDLRVELNGRTIMVERRPTFDSPPSSITIGASLIGGSSVQPRFAGWILQVERLPMPLTVVRSSRPLRLQFVPPENRAGSTEPLLTSWRTDGVRELFTLRYLPGSRIAFGYAATDGRRIEGAPRPARSGVEHTLDLASRGQDLALRCDGAEALVVPGDGLPAGRVELGQLGFNATGLAVGGARFTGSRLTPLAAAASPKPPATPGGPFRVVATLPAGRTGGLEPLIATGKAGRGDIVYVKYTDAGHIQFGYDHWGVGGSISPPIAVNYAQPHEFEVGLGSLYPDRKDAGWMGLPADVRRQLREQATVSLDGVAVWECKSPAYPSDPADIRVGENTIGASSCSPRFTGEILEIGRARP
jgi:hypothetical protein